MAASIAGLQFIRNDSMRLVGREGCVYVGICKTRSIGGKLCQLGIFAQTMYIHYIRFRCITPPSQRLTRTYCVLAFHWGRGAMQQQ